MTRGRGCHRELCVSVAPFSERHVLPLRHVDGILTGVHLWVTFLGIVVPSVWMTSPAYGAAGDCSRRCTIVLGCTDIIY